MTSPCVARIHTPPPARCSATARSSLARLLAGARPLWLLDEPGVGLDAASRAQLEAAIAAHRAADGMCLLATHGDVAVRDAYVLDFAG